MARGNTGHDAHSGLMLSHPAACALIREKALRAIENLPKFKPYRIAGPVEIRVEWTPEASDSFRRRQGIERLHDRTWVFREKDFMNAWLKCSSL